ncbi:MAG TPA: hypothetical protein PKD26_06445 [Pyrinomonadaceae bacterium]|nr:hypothetical protein [Pyrinomonadaceae bacterium]
MSDKLLVEIDMFNGELDDAVPALIYLAHELVEAGVIEINQPVRWNEKTGNAYQVKWRFSEDELHLPLDIDFVSVLRDELESLTATITENHTGAIHSFKEQLDQYLLSCRPLLFVDTD